MDDRHRHCGLSGFRPTISDEQRKEFETLVEDTLRGVEAGLFLPHSGIRFPQNPCTTCPFVGLCLEQRDLVDAALVRKPGVDLGLFDELALLRIRRCHQAESPSRPARSQPD